MTGKTAKFKAGQAKQSYSGLNKDWYMFVQRTSPTSQQIHEAGKTEDQQLKESNVGAKRSPYNKRSELQVREAGYAESA